jgi:hypothetical protein
VVGNEADVAQVDVPLGAGLAERERE